MTALILVEAVLIAVLAVLVAGLLRAYATVLQRLHKLDGGGTGSGSVASTAGGREFDLLPVTAIEPTAPVGPVVERFGSAHDIAGETVDGEVVSARVVGVEHDTLLLFLSSGCASCEVFWAELAGHVSLPVGTRLLVVAQGPREESVADLAAMAPAGIDLVLSSQAWRDYEVPGSPHVIFVDGHSGRIRGEGTGQSMRQVSELLARSTGDASFVTGAALPKPDRDAEQEAAVDRELLAAGIVPGDPRLYGGDGRNGVDQGSDN